tara:strand:- start:8374 stop:9006 length:633 start_codon:yes stop_codon:yes gene_type:complete
MNTLILLRHGQSQWNLENKFTGLKDVPLTSEGINEALNAGELLQKNQIQIDMVFSSILLRANRTAEIALNKDTFGHLWNNNKLIVTKHQSLNERDYGDLVGLNKKETAEKFGKEKVHLWRRSYEVNPPNGESLKQVVERVTPYYEKEIKKILLFEKKNVIVVAHGNSLRAIMISIGLYKPSEISSIEIPTGKPFCINFENKKISKTFYLD